MQPPANPSSDKPGANPYQSPVLASGGLPANYRPKPGAVAVFGILNLIFGIFGVLGSVCGGAVMLAAGSIPELQEALSQDVTRRMAQENPYYAVFYYGQLVVGSLGSFALLASGVGLMRSRDWGRVLAVGYAWYLIVLLVVTQIVNLTVFLPLASPAIQNGPQSPEEMNALILVLGGPFGLCIGLIYPGLMLYFLGKEPVREYLRSASSSP